MARADTLETRILKRIGRKCGDVFLRADFSDLGSYDQVGRALKGLMGKGQLLKVGYGIYTRAEKSRIDGKLYPPKGLATLTEALNRVGIETVPTRFQQDYNAGRITQVPTGRVVGVRRRVRRKIGYGGIYLSFERTCADRPCRMETKVQTTSEAPISLSDAVRLIWESDRYLCHNAQGDALTRSGFEYILDKHVQTAAKHCPSLLTKRVSPHYLRHSCALLILQSTGDIRKVALWLGHASTQTTEMYLRADTATLLEGMNSTPLPSLRKGHFRPPDQLIALLRAEE